MHALIREVDLRSYTGRTDRHRNYWTWKDSKIIGLTNGILLIKDNAEEHLKRARYVEAEPIDTAHITKRVVILKSHEIYHDDLNKYLGSFIGMDHKMRHVFEAKRG